MNSLQVRGSIVKMLAAELMMSERVINAVIDHEFELMRKKMNTCFSIEITGFGKFIFNMKKAMWRLGLLEKNIAWMESRKDELEGSKKITYLYKLKVLYKDLDELKRKIYANNGYMGGMEEQLVSPGEAEEGDRECGEEEKGDMQ